MHRVLVTHTDSRSWSLLLTAQRWHIIFYGSLLVEWVQGNRSVAARRKAYLSEKRNEQRNMHEGEEKAHNNRYGYGILSLQQIGAKTFLTGWVYATVSLWKPAVSNTKSGSNSCKKLAQQEAQAYHIKSALQTQQKSTVTHMNNFCEKNIPLAEKKYIYGKHTFNTITTKYINIQHIYIWI